VRPTAILDLLAVRPPRTALVAASATTSWRHDATATAHWQGKRKEKMDRGCPLPAGATGLDRYVSGVPALKQRLAQVGEVADAAMAATPWSLAQGQRR
jgi:hypothetical protein